MSIALALTLAAVSTVQPSCSWDRPGANPYTGTTSAAIDRYTDIPEAVRSTLKRRLAEGQADDSVHITRDAIVGRDVYDPTIHDMHFGAASMCHSVTRSKWDEGRSEPAAVYCVKEHCIVVPKICGNVSRISRLQSKQAKAGGKGGNGSHGSNGNDGKQTAVAAMPSDKAGAAEYNISDLVADSNPGLIDTDGKPEMSEEDRARQAAHKHDVEARMGELSKIDADSRVYDLSDTEYSLQASSSVPADGRAEDGLDDPYGRNRSAGTGSGLAHSSPFGSAFDQPASSDTLSATPVPEADTWAMLVAGLGLLGFVARRSRAKAARAA